MNSPVVIPVKPSLAERLIGRLAGAWRRGRCRWYRWWLLRRYGGRISIHPSAKILGRVSMHKACRLSIGAGVQITETLEVWGAATVDLAPNVNLIMGVRVYGKGRVTVAEGAVLNATKINCMQSVSIGRMSLVGAGLVTDTDFHNLAPNIRRSPGLPGITAPVHIGANVWVGYGCLVLKGVSIGDDSVVGAGSVVRSSVPAGVVVSGNPATVVRTFDPSERSDLSSEP